MMKDSAFYGKCLRLAYISVAVTAIGTGIYAVLSDNGLIPQPKKSRSDSKIGKAVSFVKELLPKN